MRLNPNGDILACCVNEKRPLGSIHDGPLLDTWRGGRVRALREALAVDDYSLGCEHCGDLVAAGARAGSLIADYDHFPIGDDLAWPTHIEFALSNTCNLQCVQCNGDLSSSIRSQREHRPPLRSAYDDRFFEEIREFLPHLRAATFIGGEPFLMRETRRIWDLLIELDLRPDVWVTTNGSIWDDRVEHYLHELEMGVSMSIDGIEPATIAAIRVGVDPEELLANRDRFLAATRSYGASMKLNFCLMPQNWQEFLPYLEEADRLGVQVYPARVLKPVEHSMASLGTDGLSRAVEAMAASAAGRVERLSAPNRFAWDRTIDDLRTQLARAAASGGAAVGVRIPVASIRAALTSSDGRLPVHLVAVGGIITSIDDQPWAAALGLPASLGRPLDSLLGDVLERLGASVADMDLDGSHGYELRTVGLETASGPILLRVGSTERTTPDGDRADVLIASAASPG